MQNLCRNVDCQLHNEKRVGHLRVKIELIIAALTGLTCWIKMLRVTQSTGNYSKPSTHGDVLLTESKAEAEDNFSK